MFSFTDGAKRSCSDQRLLRGAAETGPAGSERSGAVCRLNSISVEWIYRGSAIWHHGSRCHHCSGSVQILRSGFGPKVPFPARFTSRSTSRTGLHLCYARADWPVFRRVCQRDNDVLVDEDEEGQQEAQAHGAEDVQGRQALKRGHVEDGPVVNFEDWNCEHRHKSLVLTLLQLFGQTRGNKRVI